MKTPKNAFYGLLGLIVLLLLGGGGVYYFFDGELTELNTQVAQLLAEEDVINTQIDIYEDAEKQIEELSFVVDLADDVLPQAKEQANVVAEIRKFVTDAGMVLESLNFSGTDGGGGLSISQTEAVSGLVGVRVLPSTAIIAGGANYTQFINLLDAIESNQRKMQVTEVNLTPEIGTGTFSSITLKINIYLRAAVAVPVEDATEGEQP